MAVSGPSPIRANLQSGCDFGADMLTTDVGSSSSGDAASVAVIRTDVAAIEGLLSDSREQ
jgi:hypothetical protein